MVGSYINDREVVAMERLRVAQESGPDAIFFFKANSKIFRKDPDALNTIEVEIADEIQCSFSAGELTILSPWVLEAAMRIPDGGALLHYRISSNDSSKNHYYLIPIEDVKMRRVGYPD